MKRFHATLALPTAPARGTLSFAVVAAGPAGAVHGHATMKAHVARQGGETQRDDGYD